MLNALTTPDDTGFTHAAPAGRSAVAYTHDERGFASAHERATRLEVARRLAALKGIFFGGERTRHGGSGEPLYYVPGDTLVGELEARRLGISRRDDLYGGVVPYAFVATKAITHPLVHDAAAAPPGWSNEFPRRVAASVLDGWTAFSTDDALAAGRRLLARGPVRVKSVCATGGRGQWVAQTAAELQRGLEMTPPEEIATQGLVLEENLEDVATYSVGQVWVGDLVATYHGTQRLTPNGQGELVYGGSALTVARGEFPALLALKVPPAVRMAVEQARVYHAAALDCFPGMILSRINYDIARGRDARGCIRSGVLEQSWRVGGATGAEIAALERFRADPDCHVVQAAGYEVFGDSAAPPPAATVYFRGNDPKVGPLTKYTLIETHVDTR